MPVVETMGPSETEALGAELALRLREGDVVLVGGDLGSGKTTLVRGAARALGVTDPVTSPTFSIGHRYRGTTVTVSHLDLFRLAGLGEEDPGLLADYLGAGRIAFVEWPAEDSDELADARVRVTLTHQGGDRRLIEVVEDAEGDCTDRLATEGDRADRLSAEGDCTDRLATNGGRADRLATNAVPAVGDGA